jgi:spermidine/putrescine transport system permease protein
MVFGSPMLRLGLGAVYGVVVVLIYLPIMTMVVFSFSSGRYQTLPFRDLTLQWYTRLLADPAYFQGLVNSLWVAASASAIATIVGFGCAYALVRGEFPGKASIYAAMIAPLAVPLVIVGLSLRIYLVTLGLSPSLWLVVCGEIVYVMPLAIMNLRGRIAKLPYSHEEAAWSLGATRLRGIWDVVIPAVNPTIVATFVLCFTFAFDEFVIAYFLTNFEVLLPVKIWTTLVTGFDPTINAAGTLIFGLSLSLGLFAQLLSLRGVKAGAKR